jgi:hypothetical protein
MPASQASQQDSNYYYSIVLMSDGRTLPGVATRFHRFLCLLWVANIKPSVILFGEASVDDMQLIADLTGAGCWTPDRRR